MLLLFSLSACSDTSGQSTGETPPSATTDTAPVTSPGTTTDTAPTSDGSSPTTDSPSASTTSDPEEEDSEVAVAPETDPDSPHVLVNALNPLDPLDHRPDDLVDATVPLTTSRILLREEAAEALDELFAAAGEEGFELLLTSGYRGYEAQTRIYDERAARYGVDAADAYVARPGHSEHQTGLAADVLAGNHPTCGRIGCFADTPHGAWTAAHAADYGFIIRYPEGAEHITGYAPEPWHLRYLGVPTAQAVAESGLTLEEFWDQPPAPDYPETTAQQLR